MNARPDLVTAARDLDARLRAATRRKRRADHELGTLLLEMQRSRLFLWLGYPSLQAYADHELGLSPKLTRTLVAVARQAQTSEPLDQALATGELSYTKARELLRVADDDTMAAWIDCALCSTNRELEQRVNASRIGEAPPPDPVDHLEPARRTLVLRDLDAADAQAIEDLITALQNRAGLSDRDMNRGQALADACRAMLQRLQSEPDGPTGDRHLIVLHADATTGVVTGEHAEVTDTLVAQARCDHTVVDLRPGPNRGRARSSTPPAVRRAVLHRFRRCCGVPGCRNRLYLEVHHVDPREHGGDDDERNLIALCSQHHRLLHEGHMGAEALADGTLRFSFRDGRVLVRRRGKLDLPPDGVPRGTPRLQDGPASQSSPSHGRPTTPRDRDPSPAVSDGPD